MPPNKLFLFRKLRLAVEARSFYDAWVVVLRRYHPNLERVVGEEWVDLKSLEIPGLDGKKMLRRDELQMALDTMHHRENGREA